MTERETRDEGAKAEMTQDDFPQCPLRPDPTTLDFIEYWEREEGVTRADVDRLLATPLGLQVLVSSASNHVNRAWKALWLLRVELARLFPPSPDDVVLTEADDIVFHRRHLRILKHAYRYYRLERGDPRGIAVPSDQVHAAQQAMTRLLSAERETIDRLEQPGVFDEVSALTRTLSGLWSNERNQYLDYWFQTNQRLVQALENDKRFLAGVASTVYDFCDSDDLWTTKSALRLYMTQTLSGISSSWTREFVITTLIVTFKDRQDLVTRDLLDQFPEMIVQPPPIQSES